MLQNKIFVDDINFCIIETLNNFVAIVSAMNRQSWIFMKHATV